MKKQNHFKNIAATASVLTFFLTTVLGVQAVTAAPAAVEPAAIINNAPADGEVLMRNGTIYVTLTDLKPLGDYKISFDNLKKQATIQGDGRTVALTIGSTQMEIDGNRTAGTSAPLLHQGKVMIPLRAVAKAFGSHVYWNSAQKTAFISKADSAVIADLKSSDLSSVRNAAVLLPYISELKQPELELTPMEMQGVDYYFPRGKSDRFFLVDNDIASYFEVRNDVKFLKWQGKLDYLVKAPDHRNLFFLPAVKAEIGEQPNAKDWTVAKFSFRYPVGTTSYSLLNRSQQWGSGYVELNTGDPDYKGVIIDIPEE